MPEGNGAMVAPVRAPAPSPVGRRDRTTAWLRGHRPLVVVIGVLVVALVVVTTVGGFRERRPLGRPLTVGEVVDVGRFAIRVDRVELANTSVGIESPPEADDPVFFRIWSTVTNLTDRSIDVFAVSHVDCVVPGGRDTKESRASSTAEWGVANLDPGVPTQLYTERIWKAGSPTATPPATLQVVVLPDVPPTGFIGRDDDEPTAGSIAIGWVRLPVADKRVQPETDAG